MIECKTLKALEYDKILAEVSAFAVLHNTKEAILDLKPLNTLNEVDLLLKQTEEAYKYLYVYSVGGIYFFDDITEQLDRVVVGGVLNNLELLQVVSNLKSARIIKSAFSSVNDASLTLLNQIVDRLYVNQEFENEITSKIISEDQISDNASPKLYSIRKSIASLNAKIRAELNSYMRGALGKYLQDNVVTMRQDRYVIPVKSEYRNFVKGFIHDQSSSGATVFIEPEHVMELNNDLRRAFFDEAQEIQRILQELSNKVSYMADALRYNAQNLIDLDCCFAKAEYSFKNKCIKPILCDNGIVNIVKGRHPLINKDKVVPVSLSLGKDYNFLLISGPNTGGKTVSLKLTGLLTAMAMTGIFIPAEDGSQISVFNNIYCDIGDEQSIEQDLSTFSSHIKNIINIINHVDNKSLVLIDEIGAGTDPEEGSALALAIIKKLLSCDCFGIITTHYSRLKEFAIESKKLENACMEFDAKTLRPMYKINIGIPGSSNAIEIAKTLGVKDEVIADAISFLSTNKVSFEKVLKKAEESRRNAEALSNELEKVKAEKELELENIKIEKEKIIKEREKITQTARHETKRIVADRLADAEEIIDELKRILKAADLESKEVFRANELKNRLKNSRYLEYEVEDIPFELKKVSKNELKVGNRVFVKSLNSYAKVIKINHNKNEAEILIGDIKTTVKINQLYNNENKKCSENNIKVFKKTYSADVKTQLNIVGKTELDAMTEVEFFIDQAIVNNLEEIKIIHGVGEGILLKAVRNYLKSNKNVLEYRRGKYGEGENGVTIIKLK